MKKIKTKEVDVEKNVFIYFVDFLIKREKAKQSTPFLNFYVDGMIKFFLYVREVEGRYW